MVCKDAALLEHVLKVKSTVSRMKEKQDNLITITCAIFVSLLGHCTALNEWKKTSTFSKIFVHTMDGLSANQFQCVQRNDNPVVEDLLTFTIVLYEIDIVDRNIIGEFATPSVEKYEITVQLMRYNNHICYGKNLIAVLQYFVCPSFDIFSNRTFILERHSSTYGERFKKFYQRNLNQTREIPFGRLDSFNIKYTSQQKLFKD